ncbi:MAG TPA: hypothetical protein VD905_12195 [Flavobacteriales bacterium]|nr:hypothetical protein [Flavobacteriales bacterium]
MKKLFFILGFGLPCVCFAQIKPAKLAGTYYGTLPIRMHHGPKKSPEHQPSHSVKLILKKNRKCLYKTELFSSDGTWEISADSIVTCTFKNRFGDKKSIEESAETKKYRLNKNGNLEPLNSKTSVLHRR